MTVRGTRTLIGLAAAVTATTVLLSACGGGSDSGGGSAGPAQPGGTLRYGLSQAPTCSDPAQGGTNQTIYVTRQVVDSLTDQDPETGEITPWLAQSWEINADATAFTFHLAPDVTFSDGTPLNAESVKKNFDSITALGAAKAPLASSYLSGYTGTTVVDPLTARVEFSEPNAQFLQASSTSQLGLQGDATVTQNAEQRCTGTNIGSGPFVYSGWEQDRSASVVKRAGYSWASPVFAHSGDAHLDGIDFTVIPESGVRAGSIASDQLDVVSDALPQDAPQIESVGGQVLTTNNPGVPFGLQPNVTRGVLADPAVRAALVPAVNRQELIDTVLSSDFNVATGPLAATTPGYTDLAGDVTFDQAKAKSILDDAGWVAAGDGIRQKDGQTLSFSVTFPPVFAGNQAILELVQQQYKAVGIDLQLKLVSTAEFTAATNSGDYDAIYGNSTRADGDILRTSFGLDGRNLNRRGAIPELDAALTGQLAATDKAQRDALLATAQQQVIANGLLIPTIELSQVIGAGPNAQDVKFDASARLVFYDAWISGN